MRHTLTAVLVTSIVVAAACSDVTPPSSPRLTPGGASLVAAPKVTICHAAGRAGTTHYIQITLSANGLNGHFDNNGTPKAGHELDFIVTADRPCPGPVAAQLQVCKVLGRGIDTGRNFAFSLSTGETFTLKIGQCSEIFNVEPGNVTVTETGEIPATGSFFATAVVSVPVNALQGSSGVVALRTDLPPGVATDIVGVVATTSGNLTTITFENSN
jgi:hypothetical protein